VIGLATVKRVAVTAIALVATTASFINATSAHADYRSLCLDDAQPSATVNLTGPVNYSGLLTFSGTVRCMGASVTIATVTITPFGGSPPPSSIGPISCTDCTNELSIAATIPAMVLEYDVTMDFTVTRGVTTVSEHRLGRFVASWAGQITPLCPMNNDTVAMGETCPV